MIRARLGRSGGFAARLTAQAERLTEAAAENALRARRADPGRWRRAALLWPLFTQD